MRIRLGRFVAFLASLALMIGALAGLSSPASAQAAEGYLGWSTPGPSGLFSSADAACRAQHDWFNGNPLSRYIGAFQDSNNPRNAGCSWTTFQYLCPQETGGGISGCGTVLPTFVTLSCASGYTASFGNMCIKDPVPERPCNCNNGASVERQVGNPIVLSSGSKLARADDYSSGDGDFVISRSYRSIQVGRSASFKTPIVGLAGGWNFDFMYELQLGSFSGSPSSPNAKLALVTPDGTAYDFVMQSGGSFVPDTSTGAYYVPRDLKVEYVGTLPSDLSTLQSASTQWRVTDRDDTVWTLQTFTRPNTAAPYSMARPSSKMTREGYGWTFAYRADQSLQTVTDSFGRQATFNWSNYYTSSLASPPSNVAPYPEAVTGIALPDGTTLKYSYDPPAALAAPSTGRVERLVKVERLSAASAVLDSTTYGYNDPRFRQHLTSITDASGAVIASYSYDAAGRGTTTAHANAVDNFTVTSSETSTERVRDVTTPLGKSQSYHFQKVGGNNQDVRLTSIISQASANSPATTQSLSYDSNNFIATQTDEEGRVTYYTRDANGRPTSIVEAYGTPDARTTIISWHSTLKLPTLISRPGLQTSFTYGTTGQLLARTETDTTTQTVPYSTNGQARTWTYSWGTGGRLTSMNGPKPVDGQGKDDTLTFAYDTAGNLQTSTNGLGQVTSFANYDANGRPGTMTDPNNVVTAFTYDALGRTKTVTVRHPTTSALDAVTSFDYDIHDRVIGITLPATDKLSIDYDDAGRMIAMRAAAGERIDYQIDPQGNVTSETVKRADASTVRSVHRTFDELGRLLTEALGTGRTNSYSYDKVDNLTRVTSARSQATQAAFDPLNRLVSTVAPDSGTTSNAYNAYDQVTSHTDAVSVQTSFTRNGFGDVIQEVSPDRGTSTYSYNQAGEMISSTDGRGKQVDYTRDILGRILTKTAIATPTSEVITYVWDTTAISGSYSVGRLSQVVDGSGTTSFAYDHRGNLITKRQTIGSGTADLTFAYDLADRITQIGYPSGRLVAYGRDSKGRVAQVVTKASASDPSWTTLASAMSYDPFGSLTSVQYGDGLAMAQQWKDGRLSSKRLYTASTGVNLSSLTYGYDDDDNLGSIIDGIDASRSVYYGYDGSNRLSFASMAVGTPSTSTETYTITPGTNRLASVATPAGTRSISYDGRGNTASETRPGSVSVVTGYDGFGRLTSYSRTGDPAPANVYNGMDDRVKVTSGSTVRFYVYDNDGRMVGEYDASGAPIAETIWLSPQVANDNQPFGGDDGVGGYAPLAIAGGSGASTTLYWVHGNHMGVPTVITDASGTATTPAGYTVAGFPGQTRTYPDLYYNRYRDYDSATGRYIQADPIGLAGGENPYAYANNNPLRWSDPSGKCPWCAVVAVGFVEGVVIDYLVQKYWEKRECIDQRRLLISGAIGGVVAPISYAASPYISRGLGWVGSKLGRRATATAADAAADGAPAATPIGRLGSPMDVPSGTNVESIIGGRQFGGHALDQMQGRGVMPSAVENTVRVGRASPDPIPGRIRYYDPINKLTVVTESSGRVITVITGKR